MRVVALHVHHGLSPHADAWLAHCAERCRRWARQRRPLVFAAERLAGAPARGESVEAWARRERYRALHAMALAHGAGLVLLAQHRRDQAETFLLQALRGGGIDGLAAMPRLTVRDGVAWARPWLEASRESIDAYLRRHRLRHVDDDTNDDERFARNRLRARVWPALLAAFPQAEAGLAAAARHAAEAATLLAESADADRARLGADADLDLAAWRALAPARRSNVLRAWLREVCGASAPASLVARLDAELDPRRSRRWPAPGGELRSHRGRLAFVADGRGGAGLNAGVDPDRTAGSGSIDLSRPGVHELPAWGGAFEVRRVAAGGLPAAIAAQLEVRPRAGGERFQAGPARPPRSLKKQYQAAGIAAWDRAGPILARGDVTVFAPGLGIDARMLATPGTPRVMLAWRPGRGGGGD